MLAETPKAGGRFFRAAVVGPVLALALAPDQAGWARRPPDGPRVATTQTVPTWSRAAGRPPLSIRMLTLYAHASDRSVPIGARASWQLDASSTAAELGCSLAAPRSAEQPQHSAREGSRSWNARAASPSACYARPLVGSLRRASAGQRWTDPVRAAQRTGQLSFFREARPPSARASRRFAAALRGLRHTRRPWRAHGSVIYNLVVRSMSSVAIRWSPPPRRGALRKNRRNQRHVRRSIAVMTLAYLEYSIAPSSARRFRVPEGSLPL